MCFDQSVYMFYSYSALCLPTVIYLAIHYTLGLGGLWCWSYVHCLWSPLGIHIGWWCMCMTFATVAPLCGGVLWRLAMDRSGHLHATAKKRLLFREPGLAKSISFVPKMNDAFLLSRANGTTPRWQFETLIVASREIIYNFCFSSSLLLLLHSLSLWGTKMALYVALRTRFCFCFVKPFLSACHLLLLNTERWLFCFCFLSLFRP